MDKNRTTASFGARDVPEDDKAALVKDVFSSVSSSYDFMNDAMSLGAHRMWKSALVNWLHPRTDGSLLDVAGGTGDIAMRYLNRAPRSSVTVLDLTENMLVEGRRRAARAGLQESINWVVGDALAMPFPDRAFDTCTVSFGLRNFARIDGALAEAFRILGTGGRLMILEFSQVPNPALRRLYDLYSFKVIPLEGQLIANDRDSYQYLVESIRRFPDQEELADLMRRAGFQNVSYRNLAFGVAAMHSGWKL